MIGGISYSFIRYFWGKPGCSYLVSVILPLSFVYRRFQFLQVAFIHVLQVFLLMLLHGYSSCKQTPRVSENSRNTCHSLRVAMAWKFSKLVSEHGYQRKLITIKPLYSTLPPKTKDPTHDMKPDRKELNGNVPTRQQ